MPYHWNLIFNKVDGPKRTNKRAIAKNCIWLKNSITTYREDEMKEPDRTA